MVEDLNIIQNNESYWDFILSLRNDEEIKKGFINQDEISKESHYEYMKVHGKNYFICLFNNQPAGFVGCVNNDIRFAVLKKFQGKGIGNFMIKYIKQKFPDAQAKVKIENNNSLKCFQNNGYRIKYYILENENEN